MEREYITVIRDGDKVFLRVITTDRRDIWIELSEQQQLKLAKEIVEALR